MTHAKRGGAPGRDYAAVVSSSAWVGAFVFCFALASSAHADIVVFKTGRTMSVQSHRIEGEEMTLVLRNGGEVRFPRAVVERVDADEVPYPVTTAPDIAATVATDSAMVADATLAARPFATIISAASATYGVDARLVHAVIEAESGYKARARSRKGAKGLMQLMPATARQYAIRDAYDPAINVDAGVRHLKDLLSRFDVSLALAAYNAGEATIRRYGGIPPFAETERYVAGILRRLGR